MFCRAQAAADREWRTKENAAAMRKAAVQADLKEARARKAADRAAATAATAEAARRDAAAQSASALHAIAAQERQVRPGYKPFREGYVARASHKSMVPARRYRHFLSETVM